jgi:porin
MLQRCSLGNCASTRLFVLLAGGVLLVAAPPATHSEAEQPLEAHSPIYQRAMNLLNGKGLGSDTDDFAAPRLIGPPFRGDCGVSLEPVYYGEVFTNTRGGISTRRATQYEALLDLPLTLDFEKMQLPLPGRFYLLAQNTHGRGLTEDFVGDFQVVSNIDSADNIMQVSEYWWEIGLFDQNVAVRLGKQDVNTEFLVMDLAGDFIQSSFGLSPSAGLPSYPHASMAALVLADLTESLRMKVGIWDALGDGRTCGFSGNEVTITMGELEYKYSLFDGQLPGAVDVGVTYVSGGDAMGLTFPSAHGYYFQAEQLIYRENPSDESDDQGLGAFVSYFPRFADGEIPIDAVWADFVGGVVYRGLIPCRDEDVVGAGVAWAKLNRSGVRQETVVEFFYKVQLTPRLSLQPDVQYIASPSGLYRDALAVGLRFQLAL